MHKLPAEGSFCDECGIAQGYVTVEDYNSTCDALQSKQYQSENWKWAVF
jgi:hypothetical protein